MIAVALALRLAAIALAVSALSIAAARAPATGAPSSARAASPEAASAPERPAESGEGAVADAPPTPPAADPLRAELERCRSLAPEAAPTDEACRAAWAENRRRFFRLPPAQPAGEG